MPILEAIRRAPLASPTFSRPLGQRVILDLLCPAHSRTMQRHDLSAQMKRLSVNSPLRSITSSKTAQTKEQLVPIKTPLTQQRPASPKTRRAPPAQMGVSRYIDQCLPNCLTSPQTVVTNLDAQPLAALQTSPTASVVKRPNGTAAHLLKLPPSVPYAIRLHSGSAQGTVHVCHARLGSSSCKRVPVHSPDSACCIMSTGLALPVACCDDANPRGRRAHG